MAELILRNIDSDLKERLRQRAAAHQRSMNAELREILRDALASPPGKQIAELKKLAKRIRALSAERAQTPSQDLLRESRQQR